MQKIGKTSEAPAPAAGEPGPSAWRLIVGRDVAATEIAGQAGVRSWSVLNRALFGVRNPID
jgi:hypothetical protein